jgi:predicted component of type VI protein secretion system
MIGDLGKGGRAVKVKLAMVGGEAKASYVILRLPAVIGRGRASDLMIPHPSVSRRHCELFEREGRVCVRDLGSLNGTYVADRRIREAELPDGELLTLATLTLRCNRPEWDESPPAEHDAETVDATASTCEDQHAPKVDQFVADTSDQAEGIGTTTDELTSIDRETQAHARGDSADSNRDRRTFLDGE